MIVLDGQPVSIPDGTGDGDARQLDLLDLKLSNALLALGPPHDIAKSLHARINALMRALNDEAAGPGIRQPADLSDDDLRQAAATARALLAVLSNKAAAGNTSQHADAARHNPRGLRSILTGYALDLTSEIINRTEQGTPAVTR